MNIIEPSGKKIRFDCISVGNAFKFENAYLIKIEEMADGPVYKNAVNLRLGCTECFRDYELVEPIDCDIVIK